MSFVFPQRDSRFPQLSLRGCLRAVLDWLHRPRPNAALSAASSASMDTAAPPAGSPPLTQEQLQAVLPQLLP